MGKLNPFKKPKAPDNSALIAQQKAQEKRVAEQEAKLAAEEKAREEEEKKKKTASLSARRGRSGGTSLLTGLETGVAPVEEKRGSLG
ncbi:MAG: hypothetical protein ACPGQQ_02975 [Candidatus Puniceispirillaceae bacterium]